MARKPGAWTATVLIPAMLLALSPLAAAADYPLPPPPAVSTATRLEFSADHVDFDAPGKTLHLKGHVLVKESTRTIKADELWLDTKDRSGRSEGYLFVDDGGAAVAGESGEFNFEERTGKLSKAHAGYGDWRVHAKEARLNGRSKLDYLGANFTSCDYTPPHYHFHATRVTVVPKKHLIAYNTTFFIGRVPLFYLPIVYKSLDPDHVVPIKFQPGYDRRNGVFVKGTMLHNFSPFLYNKLYLDFYSAQGVGVGTELNHHKGDDRGVLYGYHIHENSSRTERWAVVGNVYQTLVSSLTFQGRAQIQSDATFNNNYARNSLLPVTPTLDNSGALNFRQKLYSLRLSYQREDLAAPDQIHYIKSFEDYPRLDYQTVPLAIGHLPWLNTFTGFADNNYTQGRPFIQKSAGGAWEGTRVFSLGRGFSFVPKLGYSETAYDRFDQAADFASTSTFRDAIIGHYHVNPDLRWKTRLGDWDLAEDYLRRLRPDSMADDAGAIDHGVETNLLSLRDLFHPSRTVFLRVFSGYDFRVFRDHTVGFRERVQPIVSEVTYTPRPTLNWSVRDDYQLDSGNRSVLASFLYGREDGTFGSLAGGYTLAVPDRYAFDASFMLANATGTWKVGGVVRNEIFSSGGITHVAANRLRMFDKELSLTHAWHDFLGRLMVRFRPGGVREGTVRIDLKFGKGVSKTAAQHRDWESEWFPERAAGVHDRP